MSKEIVWLTENYPPQRGGMAQSCDRIIRGLRSRGKIIHVVHFTNRKDSFSTIQQINGSYSAIPLEDSEAHTLNRTWQFLQKFAQKSVLVCFGSHLSMLGAPVFSRWFDWKLVTMIRGNDFDVSLFSPRKKGLLKEVLESSDHVVSVSKLKTEKINRLFAGVNTCTIANGIDLDEWVPNSGEEQFAGKWRDENIGDRICIGLFGELKSKKGGTFFFEALKGFGITAELHFLLVGELEEETEAFLKTEGFHFTQLPFLDRFELKRYYLCCDAIAIPSFYDGMPNVLLEAAGLGIPVIASDTDGMSDVLAEGTTGFLFPPGDAEECRHAVYRMQEQGAMERKQMGKALKNHVQNNFSTNTEINHYEELFDSLMV